LPVEMPYARHAHHLFVVRSSRRDELHRLLGELGVATGIHYPTPAHLHPCFASLGFRPGQFPQAEKAAAAVLSLPMYPELTEVSIREVASAVEEANRRLGW